MRLILLICCFLYLAHGQGNGNGNNSGNGHNGNNNGNGDENNNGKGFGNGDDFGFEAPSSVITFPGPTSSSPVITSTTSSSSSTVASSSTTSSTSATPTTSTSSTTTSQVQTSTTTYTFSQPPIATHTGQSNQSRSSNNLNPGLIIGGSVIGGIILLGIMVFIYRKIRGLDDEDFKIERQDPKPFVDDRLSVPDYGRSVQYIPQPQYAVYPTVGRPGLPGFVEKGQIVETPEQMDTNYYGTPEFGYHADFYSQYHPERSNQYSNSQLGYQVTRPQDSVQGGRQY